MVTNFFYSRLNCYRCFCVKEHIILLDNVKWCTFFCFSYCFR